MNISSIGNVPAAMSQASSGDAIAVLVLKKALDIQAQGALQLIQSLPQVAPMPNLGNNVNTFA